MIGLEKAAAADSLQDHLLPCQMPAIQRLIKRKILMEQRVQSGQPPVISTEAFQLAEEYQVGQPLACHTTRLQVLRTYKWYSRIMLIGAMGLFLIGLIILLVTLSHLLLLNSQHPIDFSEALKRDTQISYLRNQLIEDLIPVLLGFIYGVGAIVQIRLIAHGFPASVFVCTEGFLLVRPQKVDVTRWNEVTDFQRVPGTRKKKYRLNRINRKPLFFGEALEDVEGLAGLIRQQSKLSSR